MKTLFITAISIISLNAFAQSPELQIQRQTQTRDAQPFLFQVNTLTAENASWTLNYSGSYGNHAVNPLGFNGLDQHLAIKGYLGSGFTLFANAGVGFTKSTSTKSTQQIEVLKNFIGGKKAMGLHFGAGLGGVREWSNDKALFTRLVAQYDTKAMKLGGNMRFEKSFDDNRDAIDLISSIGAHRRISQSFFAGIEAVGEDLEGLWDKEEAEGGAKVFIGPSLNVAPFNSSVAFALSGGPILYVNQNQLTMNTASRDLNAITSNGYTVRFQVSYNLNKK